MGRRFRIANRPQRGPAGVKGPFLPPVPGVSGATLLTGGPFCAVDPPEWA